MRTLEDGITLQGVIKSAIFCPTLTEKFSQKIGGRGYSLHIFPTHINDQLIEDRDSMVIELGITSNHEERHDLEVNGVKLARQLSLVSPVFKDANGNPVGCTEILINRDRYISKVVINCFELRRKMHKKRKGIQYAMKDLSRYFWYCREPLFVDCETIKVDAKVPTVPDAEKSGIENLLEILR